VRQCVTEVFACVSRSCEVRAAVMLTDVFYVLGSRSAKNGCYPQGKVGRSLEYSFTSIEFLVLECVEICFDVSFSRSWRMLSDNFYYVCNNFMYTLSILCWDLRHTLRRHRQGPFVELTDCNI
jgi:hypothetical protein